MRTLEKRQPYWYGHIESINQSIRTKQLAVVITTKTEKDIN